MTVIVELAPDRKLLSPDFTGYHLSLDTLPVHRLNLPSGVDRVHPNEDQYSFLHAKVFGLHNHLFDDPWRPGTVYFFDSNLNIQGTVEEFGRVAAFKNLWNVPKPTGKSSLYNLSLSFPSFDMCVVSDGTGNLHLLNTGDRTRSLEEWQVAYSGRVPEVGEGFVLLDSRLVPDDAMLGEKVKPEQLHCLILEVNEKSQSELPEKGASRGNKEKDQNGTKFVSTINWVTFVLENDEWVPKSVVALSSLGGVDYAAIEEGCKALFIASSKPFEFNSKSDKDEEETSKTEEEAPKCPFTWMQTADDITVSLTVPASTVKCEVTVTVTATFINVSVKGEVLLGGFLSNRVDSQLTTWSIKEDKLEVVLFKEEGGLSWRELIRGDPRGEVLDSAYVEEVHQKLAHLCSETEETGSSGGASGLSSQQLEECDDVPAETSVLLRLDLDSRKVSHKASLSNYQWLFNARVLDAQVPPAICLRHDVDACVWQPGKLVEDTEIWPVRHIGTFNAFGYVQASKQDRKFTVCSPDMSYVAVCETSRHVYIYRQPVEFGGDLRCRSTGERVKKVSRQQLLQLDAGSQVLGCHAACENIFVLTTTTLYVIGTS